MEYNTEWMSKYTVRVCRLRVIKNLKSRLVSGTHK